MKKYGSFSSVSTPIFTIKDAFFNIFQALFFLHQYTIPDFCDFSKPSQYFWATIQSVNSIQFLLILLGDSRFHKFSSKFYGFFVFSGISQNDLNDFGKSDLTELILQFFFPRFRNRESSPELFSVPGTETLGFGSRTLLSSLKIA